MLAEQGLYFKSIRRLLILDDQSNCVPTQNSSVLPYPRIRVVFKTFRALHCRHRSIFRLPMLNPLSEFSLAWHLLMLLVDLTCKAFSSKSLKKLPHSPIYVGVIARQAMVASESRLRLAADCLHFNRSSDVGDAY